MICDICGQYIIRGKDRTFCACGEKTYKIVQMHTYKDENGDEQLIFTNNDQETK